MKVFFASNDGGVLGMSDLERNNKVFKIRWGDVVRMWGGYGAQFGHS